jgi:membrane protein YqaA with SNARE-associated domain
MADLVTLFSVVFVLNIVPAFAPPTWMALSWVGFNHPFVNPLVVALVGAVAATAGRLVLAKLARVIVRQRFMNHAMRGNIDFIKERLDRHRSVTFGAFLVYAFSPFPSNYLFIAYGLTSLPLWLITIPFFIGRWVSYSFFVFTAAEVSQHLAFEVGDVQRYFGVYFVISQIVLLAAVVLFAQIDWKYLVQARRFRWLPQRPPDGK